MGFNKVQPASNTWKKIGRKFFFKNDIDSVTNTGYLNDIYVISEDVAVTAYIDYSSSPYNLKFAKTIDGGYNWTNSVVKAAYGQVIIYAVDINNIFIAITDYSDSNTLKLIKTTDGGTNWSSVSIQASLTLEALSMYVYDTSTIYISYFDGTGFHVAKTIDGGTTWAISLIDALGTNNGSMKAIDVNNIFIAYNDNNLNTMKIAKTSNAGTLWTITTAISDIQVRFNSLMIADADNLLVAFQRVDPAPHNIMMAKTVDGAVSWKYYSIFSPTSPDLVVLKASLIDINNIYVVFQDKDTSTLKLGTSISGGVGWDVSLLNTGSTGDYAPNIQAATAETVYIVYESGDSPWNYKILKTVKQPTMWTKVHQTSTSFNKVTQE